MKLKMYARRFLIPGFLQTIIAYLKYGAMVSSHAEVELSPQLKLGRRVVVSSFCKLKASDGDLVIGSRTSIATGCFIGSGTAGTTIGKDCLIGPNCTIVANGYSYADLKVPIREQPMVSLGTRVGDNVYMGAGVAVVDGSDIGEGCVIAANSTISGRIPPNSIVQGNPAKIVFTRR